METQTVFAEKNAANSFKAFRMCHLSAIGYWRTTLNLLSRRI